VRGLISMSFNDNIENMTEKETKDLIDKLELMNSAEVARFLKWTTKKVSTYRERGILPPPITDIGGQPFWTKRQIEEFKRRPLK